MFPVRVRWQGVDSGQGMERSVWNRWEPQGLEDGCSVGAERSRHLSPIPLSHPPLDSQLSISADASFPEGPK